MDNAGAAACSCRPHFLCVLPVVMGFRVMQRDEVGDSAIYSGIGVFLKLMTILPYFCFLRPIWTF